jgi:hypothetical protein
MGLPITFCAKTSKGFFVKIKRYLVFIGMFSFFGGRPYFTRVIPLLFACYGGPKKLSQWYNF